MSTAHHNTARLVIGMSPLAGVRDRAMFNVQSVLGRGRRGGPFEPAKSNPVEGRTAVLADPAAFQKFQPLVKLSGNFSETPARSWKLDAPGPLR
jgi:hypothetical protein